MAARRPKPPLSPLVTRYNCESRWRFVWDRMEWLLRIQERNPGGVLIVPTTTTMRMPDWSGNKRHATLLSDSGSSQEATYLSSLYGTVIEKRSTGTNQFDIPDSADPGFLIGDEWTWACVFNVNPDVNGALVAKSVDGGETERQFRLRTTNTDPSAIRTHCSVLLSNSPAVIVGGRWHAMMVSHDLSGADDIHIYVYDLEAESMIIDNFDPGDHSGDATDTTAPVRHFSIAATSNTPWHGQLALSFYAKREWSGAEFRDWVTDPMGFLYPEQPGIGFVTAAAPGIPGGAYYQQYHTHVIAA